MNGVESWMLKKNEGPCEKKCPVTEISWKPEKLPEPSGITSELQVCKSNSVVKLADVANNLFQKKEMSESWRSDLIPIY